MDREELVNDIEYIAEQAIVDYHNGREDECYDNLLSLIDVATALSAKLKLTY